MTKNMIKNLPRRIMIYLKEQINKMLMAMHSMRQNLFYLLNAVFPVCSVLIFIFNAIASC